MSLLDITFGSAGHSKLKDGSLYLMPRSSSGEKGSEQ
jgi:hypothetical protein